jgi:hypothetical protein
MVTRRTLRRTHLLRPDRDMTALYTYCLAVLAPRYGILVHAVVLMLASLPWLADRRRKVADRRRSWEPIRGRNLTFAVGRGQREAFIEAVLELRAFRRAYRLALDHWRQGLRSVLFPVGTRLYPDR